MEAATIEHKISRFAQAKIEQVIYCTKHWKMEFLFLGPKT